MNIAKSASLRASCPDLKVGCVLATKDGHVLSIGYNGSATGEPHCIIGKDGHCLENGINHRVVHAEQNAVAHAARHGIRLDGSVAYVTTKPCEKCRILLKQSGIVVTKYPKK